MTTTLPLPPKEYPYEQIIWASTQKSINTGTSGFGLRTHSHGLSSEDASEIAQKAMVNYSLPTSQKATESDIVATPLIEDRYPSLFTFREVTLTGGRKVWVVGRTLYVVSDYGFFADIDSARRDGSNYIAHLAVFESRPDLTTLAAMIRQDKFIPVDKRLTPSNYEIHNLLVGEPTPLPTGFVSFSPSEYDNGNFLTEVALALLTARYRDSHSSTDNSVQAKKIVIRLDDDKLPDLLYTLSKLPEELTKKLQFQANTMYYTGVPEELDMIVVPSRNITRIDEEFFIVADYTGAATRTINILDSPLFNHIRKFAESGDTKKCLDTIALCANGGLDEPDPELAYWAMMLVKSTTSPERGELDTQRILTLLDLKSLSVDEKQTLNNKINEYLNSYFQNDNHFDYTASTLREGLDLLNSLIRKYPEMIRIYPESVKFVSDRIFSNPQYLGKLFHDNLQNDRFNAVIYILNEGDDKVSRNLVMESLLNTGNPYVWKKMLEYYPDTDNLEILTGLASSPMVEKASFAAEKYSPVRDKATWLRALEGLSEHQLQNLGFTDIVEAWLADEGTRREFIHNGTFAKLLGFPDLLGRATSDKLGIVVQVANKNIPSVIDEAVITEAIFQYGTEDEYSEGLIREWLKPSVTESVFTQQMTFLYSKGTLKDFAKWFEKYRWPQYKNEKSRQKAVVILIDKLFKGDKGTIDRFSGYISDGEITDAIRLNSGFGASLKRKFTGLFGKK